MIRNLLIAITLTILTGACQSNKWTETEVGNIRIISNKGGHTLGYSVNSGITLIFENGYAFKDLNKNGKLDKYEDWRLPVDIRSIDHASMMSIEQIAGLMPTAGIRPFQPGEGGRLAEHTMGKRLQKVAPNHGNLTINK